MEEIWKDIKGYEGIYQVSNKGRFKSMERDVEHCPGVIQHLNERVNYGTANGDYRSVTLIKDGKTIGKQMHRLVAEYFIPNPENKPFVNHIDNVHDNNDVRNLEWVTSQENAQHYILTYSDKYERGYVYVEKDGIRKKVTTEESKRLRHEEGYTYSNATGVPYHIQPEAKLKQSNNISRRKHIHKGNTGKFVDISKLDTYLQQGWELGRTDKMKSNLRENEYNRNRPEISTETRQKLSEARRNRIVTLETRKKLSEIHKGRTLSSDIVAKISKANLGRTSVYNQELDIERKLKLDEVDQFLANNIGWIRGGRPFACKHHKEV